MTSRWPSATAENHAYFAACAEVAQAAASAAKEYDRIDKGVRWIGVDEPRYLGALLAVYERSGRRGAFVMQQAAVELAALYAGEAIYQKSAVWYDLTHRRAVARFRAAFPQPFRFLRLDDSTGLERGAVRPSEALSMPTKRSTPAIFRPSMSGFGVGLSPSSPGMRALTAFQAEVDAYDGERVTEDEIIGTIETARILGITDRMARYLCVQGQIQGPERGKTTYGHKRWRCYRASVERYRERRK